MGRRLSLDTDLITEPLVSKGVMLLARHAELTLFNLYKESGDLDQSFRDCSAV